MNTLLAFILSVSLADQCGSNIDKIELSVKNAIRNNDLRLAKSCLQRLCGMGYNDK